MGNNNNTKTGQKPRRQHQPTKIIVEKHYVGTEKMETVFKRIAEEQITKKVKEIAAAQIRTGNGKGNRV